MRIEKAAAALRAAGITTGGAARKHLKAEGIKLPASDVLAEASRQFSVAAARHRAKRPPIGSRPWGPGGLLPKGTPAERLLGRADILIRQHLGWMREAAAGANITIAFGAPAVSVTTYQDRDVYRGRYKGWSATGVTARITVPRNWYSMVYWRGLATVDGMLTLEARHLERVDDVDLYAASWVERGRGYAARMVTGVIARVTGRGVSVWDECTYHAADAAAALRGIARKRSGAPARPPALPARKWGHVVVTLRDVRSVGACESGIRHWCHSVGLSDALDRGSATVAELAPAYKRMPARELRAAVMLAVRSAQEV
jgi:hypothetical protein